MHLHERLLIGGSATDTGGSSARGLSYSFHVSVKWHARGWVGVMAGMRRVMNSDTSRKLPLGTFKAISSPINSGAGKRTEKFCFTGSICLLPMTRSWATSVASYH